MWSGAWKKAHLRNLLANTYKASTVSRAIEWWSEGPGFNPVLGNLWRIFFALPCVEICGIIVQKWVSWKTGLSNSSDCSRMTAETMIFHCNTARCESGCQECLEIDIWVFHDKVFLSDYLTDLYKGKSKKNSLKIGPSGVWNQDLWIIRPSTLPTELDRRLLTLALFVSCTTSHVELCSFLESIEHDFIKHMKIQSGHKMLT